ncbi:uncharacterized protein LOC142666144 isoform X2 [Rhinoderma darwinii]|uniref:uncharacterized protein LOC142666144 isoform X2 n=1 Tax=Rhinoderma darwinii TaxID=43563 RepID=UPI003F668DFE
MRSGLNPLLYLCKPLKMMPCYQHMNDSSPCRQCDKQKNGFDKELSKGSNGKHLRIDSEDYGSVVKSSPDNVSKQQCQRFHWEGEELIQILEKDPSNLEAVSKFVQKHKDMSITWKNSDHYLRICDLSGTIYMGQKFMQEGWEELYLPKKTRMQVFGTLENSQVILPSVQWIILVGEDGCIYAYGEEELQLIAKSLREFENNGKVNLHSYPYPECSDEEEESLQQDQEILNIRKRARDFVNKNLENRIMGNRGIQISGWKRPQSPYTLGIQGLTIGTMKEM